MLVQEPNDLISVDVNPRFFAERIMAARNGRSAMADAEFIEFAKYLQRKIDRKTEVVFRVNITLRTCGLCGQFFNVCHGRNRHPIFAEFVERYIVAKTFAD